MKRDEVNIYKIHLENIFAVFGGMKFSRRRSAAIVGGMGRLDYLVLNGKIDVDKSGKNWKYNSGQVLRHCRDMRKKGGVLSTFTEEEL